MGKKNGESLFFTTGDSGLCHCCVCVSSLTPLCVYFFLVSVAGPLNFAIFAYLFDVYCIVLFLSLTFIFLNGDCCLVHEV